MNFSNVFLMVSISVISGIAGGLVVVWFFKGIHFGDRGIRLDNKKFAERYFLKYSFILATLIIAALLTSLVIFLFNKIEDTLPIIILLGVGSLIWVILIIKFRLR